MLTETCCACGMVVEKRLFTDTHVVSGPVYCEGISEWREKTPEIMKLGNGGDCGACYG